MILNKYSPAVRLGKTKQVFLMQTNWFIIVTTNIPIYAELGLNPICNKMIDNGTIEHTRIAEAVLYLLMLPVADTRFDKGEFNVFIVLTISIYTAKEAAYSGTLSPNQRFKI